MSVVAKLNSVARRAAALKNKLVAKRIKLPLAGFEATDWTSPLLDSLPDEELARLNDLLPWSAFTIDSKGRRLGKAFSHNKRIEPQTLPDQRIVLLNALVDLSDKHVLELGCFEGIHTTALCRFALQVSASDSRIEHLIKSLVRCQLYGHKPDIICCDLENVASTGDLLPRADVLHHVGVLYHLTDPVAHLNAILPNITDTVMLDTHYAMPEQIDGEYAVDGETYPYKTFAENGRDNPFAGMADHAKWLLLVDLKNLLAKHGFNNVVHEDDRSERNGMRIHLVARRS